MFPNIKTILASYKTFYHSIKSFKKQLKRLATTNKLQVVIYFAEEITIAEEHHALPIEVNQENIECTNTLAESSKAEGARVHVLSSIASSR